MFFYKKRKKGNKKNKGGSNWNGVSKKSGGISHAQIRAINERILSKKRLIVYAESEM